MFRWYPKFASLFQSFGDLPLPRLPHSLTHSHSQACTQPLIASLSLTPLFLPSSAPSFILLFFTSAQFTHSHSNTHTHCPPRSQTSSSEIIIGKLRHTHTHTPYNIIELFDTYTQLYSAFIGEFQDHKQKNSF